MNHYMTSIAMVLILTHAAGCAPEEEEEAGGLAWGDTRVATPDHVTDPSSKVPLERMIVRMGAQPLSDHVEVAPGVFILKKVMAAGLIRYEPAISIEQVQYSAPSTGCNPYDYEVRNGNDVDLNKWTSLAFSYRKSNGDLAFVGAVSVESEQGPIGLLETGGLVTINGLVVGFIYQNAHNSAGPAAADGSWIVPCTGQQVQFQMSTTFVSSSPGAYTVEHDNVDLTMQCCPQ